MQYFKTQEQALDWALEELLQTLQDDLERMMGKESDYYTEDCIQEM